MPLKNIYAIHVPTKFGFGMQPMKGDTAKQAKERYKKRYPKSKVLSVSKITKDHKHYSHFQSSAK